MPKTGGASKWRAGRRPVRIDERRREVDGESGELVNLQGGEEFSEGFHGCQLMNVQVEWDHGDARSDRESRRDWQPRGDRHLGSHWSSG